MDQLKEALAKLPMIPLLVIWAAFLVYDYYTFTTDPASELANRKSEIQSVKESNIKLENEIKKVEEFRANLESIRVELRNAAQKLDSFKATISENLDVAEFTKLTTTEAKRVGISMAGIKPLDQTKKEYYIEQPFEFAFRGAFVQLVVLLKRLSNLQKVVRVDNFEVRPISSPNARIVELQGTMQIKAYRYLGSRADEVSQTPSSKPSKAGGT